MAIVLGMDTATTGCSVALVRDGGDCLARSSERMARGQSEALAPMMAAVIAEAGIGYSDIDAVAVTVGPGAFTGLRIGIAAARATALAIGCPCLGIGTFAALAADACPKAAAEGADAVLIAVDSKRDDLFLQAFDSAGRPLGAPVAAPASTAPERLGQARHVAVAGDAAAAVIKVLQENFLTNIIADVELADPETVARLGFSHLADPASAPAEPVYLRAPDISLPK